MTEIPLTPEFKRWADECGKCFGGLDLFAVDALEETNAEGRTTYKIIELNGSACGFQTDSYMEDSTRLAKAVHERLNEIVKVSKKKQLMGISKLDPHIVAKQHQNNK